MPTTATPPTIYEAIRNVVGGLTEVARDGYNENQRFAFRSIEGTVAAVRPLLLEQEITFIPSFEKLEQTDYPREDGKVAHRSIVKGTFKLIGPAGDEVTTETIGEAVDYEGRATNKATSAATKLFLLRFFQIGSGEDGDTYDNQPQARPAPPSARPGPPAQRPADEGLRGRVAARVPAPRPAVAQAAPSGEEPATQPQCRKMYAMQNAFGWSKDDLLSFAGEVTGVYETDDRNYTKSQASRIIEALEQEKAGTYQPPADYPQADQGNIGGYAQEDQI